MLNRILLLAVAACAAPAILNAQGVSAPSGDTLDLPRAIALARTKNPMLAARAAEVRAAAARIGPAGALPDPTLTLGAMNYMLPSLSATRDPLSMNQVTVMQMLPVNGTLGLRRRVARADSARADYRRLAAQLEIEREVRAKYWELYHTDRALEIMTRTLTVTRQLSDISGAMYSVGAAVQSDVIRAQVGITRMQQEITDMQLLRFAAASEMNALLGRPGETPVVLPTPGEHEAHGLEMHTLDMPDVPSLDSLAALAEARNPELLAAQALVEAASDNETAVRRMIYPDLGLGLAYGQRVGDNDMLSAMVSVSVPLFARAKQFRMRDEARAMREAATQELAGVRVRVRSILATARAQVETARRLVELYVGSLVPQANASYESALAAYRVGRVDFPTVLDAQMSLLTYEHDWHRYEAMYGTAVAEIDRLIGRAFVAPPVNR